MDSDDPGISDDPFQVPNTPGWHRGYGFDDSVIDSDGDPAPWFWHRDIGYWIMRASYLRPSISLDEGDSYEEQADHVFVIHVGWQGRTVKNYDVPSLTAFLYLLNIKEGEMPGHPEEWDILQCWHYLNPDEVIHHIEAHEAMLAGARVTEEQLDDFLRSVLDGSGSVE